jgi:hypothetical protein
MSRPVSRVLSLALLVVVIGGLLPPAAQAHGPVAPTASSYLARVSSVPAGVEARVVDGDQRMWLRVVTSETVVVLDYQGAPYLWFSRGGVDVNQNSAMYYTNQSPPQTPPPGLTRATAPRWHRVSGAHAYGWHDGRLHALAAVALPPGVAYVGRWRIPVLVEGRLSSIVGGLWHAERPSIVWFWPIVVVLLCVLAARRVRRRELDMRVARVLAGASLIAITLGGLGRELHGRPTVSPLQLVTLALIVAFVAWGSRRVLSRDCGYFPFFLIAGGAFWAGLVLLPTLLHGFVLMAVPAFLARVATVVCLACGAALLVLSFRLADYGDARSATSEDQADDLDSEDDLAQSFT